MLQRAQLFARLEPEVVHQYPARVLVDSQRVRLPAGTVERAHQLTPESLPQGVLLDELLELSHQILARTKREIRIDPLFERRESRLLQAPDLVAQERLEGEILERRSAPERQRCTQLLGPFARLCAARLGRQALEARQIEQLGVDAEDVAGRLRDDELGPDRFPQPRDVVLERRRRRLRRLRTPDLVDQPVTRDELSSRKASNARVRCLSSGTERPSSTTANGPRMRNSTGMWPL